MMEESDSWERNTINKMLEMSVKEQRASRRWGIFFKLCFLGYIVLVSTFLFMGTNSLLHSVQQKPFTAVIDVKGMLASDKPASAQNINPLLRKAFEDPLSRAIVLRINSPGGSPVQSKQIYTEMKRLRAKHPDKKLYAVIEESGASGAYWLACGADEIYADETSIVGSIGVVLSSFGLVDTMKKLGVERRLYTAGDNKAMLDPFSPRDPKQDAMLNDDLSEVHKLFIDLVKNSRGERLKISDDMFSGRFWLGIDAKNLGLIDGFGDTATIARDVIKVPDLVVFETKESVFSQLGGGFGKYLGNVLLDYKLG
jgi:protease-4